MTGDPTPTGDAVAADTSREDAPSNQLERDADREAAQAERHADRDATRAEGSHGAAEVEARTEEAGERLYGEFVGLAGHGQGEAPVRVVEVLGRIGLLGYGLVHLAIGVIAVQVAVLGRGQPDQQGALTGLAEGRAGHALIVIVVGGLAAFALWQGLAAFSGFRWTSGSVRMRKRVGAGAKTIAVLAVAGAAVRLLVTGSAGGSSSAGSEQATALLLTVPAGRVAVALVGVVVLVVAGAMSYTGLARTFSDDLDYDRLPERARRWVEVFGVVGHLARAIAFAVVGVLFGVAALDDDPARAGGLDDALKALAAQPFGPVLLIAVGLGFAAFGVYTLAESRIRRI